MKFTRREKIILAIAAALYILFMTVEQTAIDRWEWFVPPVVIALGWYITTDPENKKSPEGRLKWQK